MSLTKESDKNGCEDSLWFGEEDNHDKNESRVALEDTCLSQYR